MYIGYETEIAILIDGILRKQSSVRICGGVEVRLRTYHTNSRKQAEKYANEVIAILHDPTKVETSKPKTKTAKKRKPKGKKVNGILYLI